MLPMPVMLSVPVPEAETLELPSIATPISLLPEPLPVPAMVTLPAVAVTEAPER